MFYIDRLTGEVDLSRGDNATFTLHINQGSNLNPLQYKLKDKDRIYFAIEEPNQPFENAIVKKVIDLENNLLDKNGNITFDITPNDTVLLMPGLYYYEIKAKLYKGNQYRNGYLIITLELKNKENNIITGTYDMVDTACMNNVSSGQIQYNSETKELLFTEYDTQNQYKAILTNNLLKFDDYPGVEFSGLAFKQEQDIVNTIIPQTKWIVER